MAHKSQQADYKSLLFLIFKYKLFSNVAAVISSSCLFHMQTILFVKKSVTNQ